MPVHSGRGETLQPSHLFLLCPIILLLLLDSPATEQLVTPQHLNPKPPAAGCRVAACSVAVSAARPLRSFLGLSSFPSCLQRLSLCARLRLRETAPTLAARSLFNLEYSLSSPLFSQMNPGPFVSAPPPPSACQHSRSKFSVDHNT